MFENHKTKISRFAYNFNTTVGNLIQRSVKIEEKSLNEKIIKVSLVTGLVW